MASIEEVIARSRQPGALSVSKQFTVARDRAIAKLRAFALPDPHFYVLELIQAAVANGASYLSLDCSRDAVGASWIGGVLREEELGQLFDFLFTSSRDLERGHLRQLALGVNALMSFAPERITIESGDGTLEGTSRIVIDGRQEHVQLGQPQAPLEGTWLRAEGLRRRAIDGKSTLQVDPRGCRERAAIEERCLAAPIPILYNDEPLFGVQEDRQPTLLGCDRQIGFDEGELYGAIGFGEFREVKLLTHGVWITTITADDLPGLRFGGIVCWDRLNKTADHAGIVRDAVFDGLWQRLALYEDALRSGTAPAAVYKARLLAADADLDPFALRELLERVERVVAVRRTLDPVQMTLAARIGRRLGAHVIQAPAGILDRLHLLGGSTLAVFRPSLDDERDAGFAAREPWQAPARPWLIGAVEVDPLPAGELLGPPFPRATDPRRQHAREALARIVGRGAGPQATVYTPDDPRGGTGLRVQLLTLDRLLWEGEVDSPFPGHVLVARLPDVSPAQAKPAVEGDDLFLRPLAQRLAAWARPALEEATRRALSTLDPADVSPRSSAARMALAALARLGVPRLRTDAAGGLKVTLAFPGAPEVRALARLPLLRTLTGATLSVEDLAAGLGATGGLLYGVVEGVEAALEGLDRGRILALDALEEAALVQLFGEGSYVRVDRRDELAVADGWTVRDMAVGIRRAPASPVQAEGATGQPSAAVQAALVEGLLTTLRSRGTGADDEEARRQALRHLQWIATRRVALGEPVGDAATGLTRTPLDGVPLFHDTAGRAWGLRHVLRALAGGPLDAFMQDAELGRGVAAYGRAAGGAPIEDAPRDLVVTPFLFALLAPLGPLRPAADYVLSDEEAASAPTAAPALLVEVAIDAAHVVGSLGVPREAVARPQLLVIDPEGRVHSRAELARDLGVVGLIRCHAEAADDADIVRSAGLTALSRLLDRLPELQAEPALHARSVEVLLGWAGRRVRLTAGPHGAISARVDEPLAARILDLPLFDSTHGVPLSGWRLLCELSARASHGADPATAEAAARALLAPDQAPARAAWLDVNLTTARIARPAGGGADDPERRGPRLANAALEAPRMTSAAWLEARLEAWLDHLRRDQDGWPLHAVVGERENLRAAPAWARELEDWPRKAPLRLVLSMPHAACFLAADHPLVARALSAGPSAAEPVALLLLLCYGAYNADRVPVTNADELAFQAGVLEALTAGALSGLPTY